MYRIEIAPGEETVFRTIEELAVGIRNGVVTQRARVYHNASQKWLPIGLHPHYKKAMELPAAPRIRPRESAEHRAPARIPAPVASPVVAMQREVLRDLPLVPVAEPGPLPWNKPPEPVAPPAPRVHAAPPAPIARIAQTVQSVRPVEPVEPAPARPPARRAPRAGGHPLLMLGAAAALALGTQFALSARPSPSASTDETVVPSEPAASAGTSATAGPRDRVTSAPARVPMTPGPAFAGSVPVRSGPAKAPASATSTAAPVAAATAEAPAITPAPVELDLALPELSSDSVVPAAPRGDTMAMKNILRALNGAKPEAPAVP